jgi:SH3-like domain-containing protein
VWAPEPGFWQVDKRSGATAPPGRPANGNVRYYAGGAATFLLVAAGAAFLALNWTRDAAVSPPLVDTGPPATTAAVAGEADVAHPPPIAAAAGHRYGAAPAMDEIDALEPDPLDRLAVLPDYAAVADEPMAGDRRVEAREPLGHGLVAENLGNQGFANALTPGSPLPFPAVPAEALAAADPVAIDEDAAGMAVLVETTTIPVTTAAVTTAWVNLRAGPDNGADIIAVIDAGATLQVIECDRWCTVVADGTRGWIHRDFLDGEMLPERTDPDAANVAPFTATATAWLRIYDSPFEGGQVAASVRAGSEIFIVGCDANWCETRFESDRRGWVDRRLVGMPADITERQIPPLPPITRDEAAGR